MRSILIVLSLIISLDQFGQTKSSLLFDLGIDGKFKGKDSLIQTYNGNTILEKGRLAIDNNGHLSGLRIGVWETYLLNGVKKDSGEYRISFHYFCDYDSSIKIEYYNYKYGQWSYYNYEHELIARGVYKLITTHLIEKCNLNGTDSLIFGITDNKWYLKKERSNGVKNEIESYNNVFFPFGYPYSIIYQFDRSIKKIKRKVVGE